MKTIADKEIQALFTMKKKVDFSNLKPKLATKIFESIISPILLYNSEVWGAFTCINKDFHKWNRTPIEKKLFKILQTLPRY